MSERYRYIDAPIEIAISAVQVFDNICVCRAFSFVVGNFFGLSAGQNRANENFLLAARLLGLLFIIFSFSFGFGFRFRFRFSIQVQRQLESSHSHLTQMSRTVGCRYKGYQMRCGPIESDFCSVSFLSFSCLQFSWKAPLDAVQLETSLARLATRCCTWSAVHS